MNAKNNIVAVWYLGFGSNSGGGPLKSLAACGKLMNVVVGAVYL